MMKTSGLSIAFAHMSVLKSIKKTIPTSIEAIGIKVLTGGSWHCNGETCSALPRRFLIRVYTYAMRNT